MAGTKPMRVCGIAVGKREGEGRMKRKGFTLVELLVVIAIIGLLAGLLFPVISKVQGQAKIRQCQSHLKEMGVAFELYFSIFQVYPNTAWGGKRKVAQLVACKRVGFSPKQCVCPVAQNTVADVSGSSFVLNYSSQTAPGGQAAAAGSYPVTYGSRADGNGIPADAVDPAGTPIAAGNEECRTGHGNVINVLFLDKHVEQISDSDVWNNATNAKSLDLSVLEDGTE